MLLEQNEIINWFLKNPSLPGKYLLHGKIGSGKITLVKKIIHQLKIKNIFEIHETLTMEHIELIREYTSQKGEIAFIIKNLEKASRYSYEGLLKILEESKAKFFMTCSSKYPIPKTIISRCIILDLKPMEIKTNCEMEKDFIDGCILRSIALKEQKFYKNAKNYFEMFDKKNKEIFKIFNTEIDEKKHSYFIEYILNRIARSLKKDFSIKKIKLWQEILKVYSQNHSYEKEKHFDCLRKAIVV